MNDEIWWILTKFDEMDSKIKSNNAKWMTKFDEMDSKISKISQNEWRNIAKYQEKDNKI